MKESLKQKEHRLGYKKDIMLDQITENWIKAYREEYIRREELMQDKDSEREK